MAIHITGDDTRRRGARRIALRAAAAACCWTSSTRWSTRSAAPRRSWTGSGASSPADLAAAEPEKFASLCSEPPAVHRFPGSMAQNGAGLARIVVDEYDGQAERIWTGRRTRQDLLRRMTALPGFGKQKAQIFMALLAKQLDVRPEGWEAAAGDYSQEGYRSVADVVDAASLEKVRAYKKEKKAARRPQPERRAVPVWSMSALGRRDTMGMRLLTCTGLVAPQ